jgi:hypothetical protein
MTRVAQDRAVIDYGQSAKFDVSDVMRLCPLTKPVVRATPVAKSSDPGATARAFVFLAH